MNLKKALELRKHKYISKKRGKGGEWEYKYSREKKTKEKKSLLKEKENGISILDYEHCYIFDKENKVMFEKSGSKSQITFDKNEMIKMKKAKIFTHNHPRDLSFSVEDMKLLYMCKLDEMRAVGLQYIYSAKIDHSWTDSDWDSFIKEIITIHSSIKKEFYTRIDEGQMTIEQAEKYHWHAVWLNLNKSYNSFKYERITRPIEEQVKLKSAKGMK